MPKKPKGFEHKYNAESVSKSIKTSRVKIGKKEARLIHALLKGRG